MAMLTKCRYDTRPHTGLIPLCYAHYSTVPTGMAKLDMRHHRGQAKIIISMLGDFRIKIITR